MIFKVDVTVARQEKTDIFNAAKAIGKTIQKFVREALRKHVLHSFAESLHLEVEHTLVVSTAHISKEVNDYFESLFHGIHNIEQIILVREFEYGWVVYVPTNEGTFTEDIEDMKNSGKFNDSFIELYSFAHELKFNYIKLDRDGPMSPHFKQFDW